MISMVVTPRRLLGAVGPVEHDGAASRSPAQMPNHSFTRSNFPAFYDPRQRRAWGSVSVAGGPVT
jgi:hypothetical protein